MKIFVAIVFFGIVSFSIAQVRIGPTIGLNIPNVAYSDNGGTYSTKPIVAYQLGATVELPIFKFLSLDPSLIYSLKGFKYTTSSAGSSYYYTRKVHYIEAPINVKIKLKIKESRLILYWGTYDAWALYGKEKSSGTLGTETRKLNIGKDIVTDDIKPYEYGFNYGLGIEFKKIYYGVQYSTGRSNLSPTSKDGKNQLNNVAAVLLSYKFALKSKRN